MSTATTMHAGASLGTRSDDSSKKYRFDIPQNINELEQRLLSEIVIYIINLRSMVNNYLTLDHKCVKLAQDILSRRVDYFTNQWAFETRVKHLNATQDEFSKSKQLVNDQLRVIDATMRREFKGKRLLSETFKKTFISFIDMYKDSSIDEDYASGYIDDLFQLFETHNIILHSNLL